MRAGIKNTCTLIILVVFIVAMMLLIKVSKEYSTSTEYIRAIGYPRDTVIVQQIPCLVVEMHDYVNNTVYFDTIPINTRTPSTLEDFDPKWRNKLIK